MSFHLFSLYDLSTSYLSRTRDADLNKTASVCLPRWFTNVILRVLVAKENKEGWHYIHGVYKDWRVVRGSAREAHGSWLAPQMPSLDT